jgi:hypothetical protein
MKKKSILLIVLVCIAALFVNPCFGGEKPEKDYHQLYLEKCVEFEKVKAQLVNAMDMNAYLNSIISGIHKNKIAISSRGAKADLDEYMEAKKTKEKIDKLDGKEGVTDE